MPVRAAFSSTSRFVPVPKLTYSIDLRPVWGPTVTSHVTALAVIGFSLHELALTLITSIVPLKWFALISLPALSTYSQPFILTSAVSAALPTGTKLQLG